MMVFIMSRIEDAFKTMRSLERGEPQPTANNEIYRQFVDAVMNGAGLISVKHIPIEDFYCNINDGGGEHF